MINDLEDLKVDTCQVDADGKTLETFNVPDADGQAVAGSCREDLDEELVSRYIAAVRETTPRLVNENDTDVLYYTGVVADRAGTELTVAGLYALGEYPQRLLPHLTLTAAVEGRGDGNTEYALPMVAVREVIANALVHRDLSEASRGKGIDLRITHDGFRLTNPGGLWGITVDRLGSGEHPAVNEKLYQICRNVQGHNGRVIEAMGTGIREARRELRDAGMAEPRFYDNGVSFTVRFPNSALIPDGDLTWLGGLGSTLGLNQNQKKALVDMRHGRIWSNSDYRDQFGVSAEQARSELRELLERGLAIATGQRRWVRYQLAQNHQH